MAGYLIENPTNRSVGGFTLIELSIVLVIIGLIVGGVLVGQDLIRAAAVRATITQIEKYNTAVHTFQTKYGALPGDLNSQVATQFGFLARGPQPAGEGDGNGIIQGWNGTTAIGNGAEVGETVLFWSDLTYANGQKINLIEGSFNSAAADGCCFALASTAYGTYFPPAKIGQGNYIYVYSGGYFNGTTWMSDGVNYFGLSNITGTNAGSGDLNSIPGLTVQQAYSIDKKIDDGSPQGGNVQAIYENSVIENYSAAWASGGGVEGARGISLTPSPSTSATSSSSITCYDNGGVAGATQQYSLEISNGSNVNCALSFRFQ